VVLEEARESYDKALVHEITSQTEADLQGNVERVKAWVEQWKVCVCLVDMTAAATLSSVCCHSAGAVAPSVLLLPLSFFLPPSFSYFSASLPCMFSILSQADCEARVK